MTSTTSDLPLLLEEVECVSVERLSPSFVRVELTAPGLADLGVDGPWWDQRIKLVFPHEGGPLPSFDGADESWLSTWLDRPVEERGHMRTYTVRRVLGHGASTRVVVDVVVHGGECGPAGTWGRSAQLGDRLVMMAPRRGVPYGGIEFVPGDARHLLLVGDETAVPAVSAILEQLCSLQPGVRGHAFLEVPTSEDRLELDVPSGVGLTWLPRDGAERGVELHRAVLDHLGAGARYVEVSDDDVDPDLWETPAYSSSGEDVDAPQRHVGSDLEGMYAWIAGESKVVTGLRRALVKDLGVDRHQVAFMGYWRLGVAMKS
ncbi:siderophore-interacting protein [Nocardioides litoris]|uniref:siderophore-interacting protein n=1 Tax=Nocardioides litoris TaxID=1926648 RepID=UPI00111E5A74|nr:siderophore-interacting protein [Nocardioides litoris]